MRIPPGTATALVLILTALSGHAQEVYRDCPAIDSCLARMCATAKNISTGSCPLAQHLAPFAAALHETGNACSTITSALKKRHESLIDTTRFTIDESQIQWAGPSDAPIRIVLYISMSCPLCKKIYGDLYDSLTVQTGAEKLMRIGIKNFSETRFDHIAAAAAFMGVQPALLKSLAPIKQRLTDSLLLRIADSLGIPGQTLLAKAQAPATRAWCAASRAEALRNGVTIAPTVFINNRHYRSYKDARWLVDAARYHAQNQPKH